VRRRLLTLAIAALLTVGMLPANALTTAVPVVASDSVKVVGSIPNATAISAAFASDAPIMYLHTLNGLVTYDISNPELPVPMATLPLPNFQNEAMSLGERSDGTKFLIVGFDIYGVTPQDSDRPVALDYELVIIDVTDPAAPRLRGRTQTESSTHTVSCADPECMVAYTSGAYEPFFNPIDLSDLDNPKQLPQIRSIAGSGHDWDADAVGLQWHVGTQGMVAYDTTDPTNPVPVASTDRNGVVGRSAYNNFILHNSIRPHAEAFTQTVGEDGRLTSGDPDLFSGNVLLATEEDYIDATCKAEGAFSTWHIPYLDAEQYAADNPEHRYGFGKMKPLDLWNTELLDSGVKTPAGAFCSAHYFDYHQDGIVAQGWYQQGTRFLDVRDPSNIKQVGYFFTGAMETWGAYWVPEYDDAGNQTGNKTDIVYTNDVVRGLDILQFDFAGLQAPADTENQRAPILPQWLNASATTLVSSLPSKQFGYLCRLTPGV